MAEEKEDSLKRYALSPFSADSLKQTRSEWEAQVAKFPKDLLPSDFQRIVDWAADHMDYGDGEEGLAYGVFGPNRKSADAIIEVVYTKSGNKWLKMLNLFLSPRLFAGFIIPEEQINTTELLNVYATALVGTVKLTGVHPSKTVKLYGRSGTLLTFLKGISAHLQEHSKAKGITVNMDGRWMVFRTK